MRWAVFFFVALGIANAGPTVEIRAHTQLSIGRVKKGPDGQIEVLGHLNDKLTGDGIANQRVQIVVGGQVETAYTAADGSFKATFAAPVGEVQVTLNYEGGGRLEKAVPLTVTTDPEKSQIDLAIVKTAEDPAGARMRVTATSDGTPVGIPIELAIAPVGLEDLKPLFGAHSNTEFTLTRKQAGGGGMYRVRATFPGDAERQKATATVTLELTSNTETTMSLSSAKLAYEDELAVTGRVTDDDQQPVAHAAVTLVSGDRRLAQGTTNDQGRYRFEIEAEIFGQGQFGVQVQTDPGKTFVKPSRSQPEIIRIAPPAPVPVSYTIIAFIATALAAGGFFAARNKPWRRFRRPAPPAEVPSEEGEIAPAHGGLVVAKPSIVSTLRRPHDEGFSGVVRDTVRGRPVEDALVQLVLGDTERSMRTAADGAFALEQLAAGEWRAEVVALGHVTERFTVSIPHRGELRGVRIDLVPVRERVFQLYRRAAEPVLPETRLWGIWSPRQIVDHVRSRRPSPALADLTDFVEEVYFSPRLAAESVLPQASERVDRAIQERARPARV